MPSASRPGNSSRTTNEAPSTWGASHEDIARLNREGLVLLGIIEDSKSQAAFEAKLEPVWCVNRTGHNPLTQEQVESHRSPDCAASNIHEGSPRLIQNLPLPFDSNRATLLKVELCLKLTHANLLPAARRLQRLVSRRG